MMVMAFGWTRTWALPSCSVARRWWGNEREQEVQENETYRTVHECLYTAYDSIVQCTVPVV